MKEEPSKIPNFDRSADGAPQEQTNSSSAITAFTKSNPTSSLQLEASPPTAEDMKEGPTEGDHEASLHKDMAETNIWLKQR